MLSYVETDTKWGQATSLFFNKGFTRKCLGYSLSRKPICKSMFHQTEKYDRSNTRKISINSRMKLEMIYSSLCQTVIEPHLCKREIKWRLHQLNWIIAVPEKYTLRQMETFSSLLALCEGNPPVTGGFPSQRPMTRSFDVFVDRRLTNGWANNRDAGNLRRQSRSLWRHRNDASVINAWASIGSINDMTPHYLHQCWLLVNWTLGKIFQWYRNQNRFFIQEK